jgi:hypothetical protein
MAGLLDAILLAGGLLGPYEPNHGYTVEPNQALSSARKVGPAWIEEDREWKPTPPSARKTNPKAVYKYDWEFPPDIFGGNLWDYSPQSMPLYQSPKTTQMSPGAGEHKHEEGDLYVFIDCEDKSNLDTCTLGHIPNSCVAKGENGRLVVNQEKEGCREGKMIRPPESGRILRQLGYIK